MSLLMVTHSPRSKRSHPDQAPDSPVSSDYQAEDDAGGAIPPSPPTQPRRRGRKPGTLSRAAREAQRKTNHSLIEKARRTKINDALATLRELVPPEYKRANDAAEHSDDDDDEPKKNKPKQKAGEKEFKLEILVRTVAYLHDLTEKVKHLEEDGCPNCKHSIRASSSRDKRPSKRSRQDFESSQPDEKERARPDVARPDDQPSRLPSISTWLPPSSERRSLLLTPSQSPSTLLPTSMKPQSLQLPTPPTSVTFNPSSSVFGVPPVLTLPSPSAFLPSSTQIQPCFSGFIPRRSSSDVSSPSSTSSPTYSPEDETAASLLLRISASSASPQAPHRQTPLSSDPGEGPTREGSVHALTPSRLLGLTAGK